MLNWNAMAQPYGGLLGPSEPETELRGLLGAEGLLDRAPFSAFPLRMRPPQPPQDQWWHQFHDEQLYRGMKREDIPPAFRPPIEVSPPDKPWWMPGRHTISGLP